MAVGRAHFFQADRSPYTRGYGLDYGLGYGLGLGLGLGPGLGLRLRLGIGTSYNRGHCFQAERFQCERVRVRVRVTFAVRVRVRTTDKVTGRVKVGT